MSENSRPSSVLPVHAVTLRLDEFGEWAASPARQIVKYVPPDHRVCVRIDDITEDGVRFKVHIAEMSRHFEGSWRRMGSASQSDEFGPVEGDCSLQLSAIVVGAGPDGNRLVRRYSANLVVRRTAAGA